MRVIAGAGSLSRLGEVAAELGGRHVLLIADRGVAAAGYAAAAEVALECHGLRVDSWHDIDANPDERVIEAGAEFAQFLDIHTIVALGGGSSLDTAKAINFLLTNGGKIADYRGYDRAQNPLKQMIAVPTTAGTGSEAQSYAVISDAVTHVKMACGAPSAAFRAVILDPLLLTTAPRAVIAQAGYDAISHAVESFVSARANPVSRAMSREAFRLLDAHYERVLAQPGDVDAQSAMQTGAYLAGLAIEHSMLGATHACANPLSANYDTVHGTAIAILLECVVRWNGAERYRELHADLPARLADLAAAAGLPRRLREIDVPRADLGRLAAEASSQWTGMFNPRKFDVDGAMEIYECAY